MVGLGAKKSPRLNIFALAVAMIGVGIISLDSAGEPEMAGVLLALLSGVLFAVYMINLQRTQKIASRLSHVDQQSCLCVFSLLGRSSSAGADGRIKP